MNETPFVMLFYVHGGYYAQSNLLQSTSWMETI